MKTDETYFLVDVFNELNRRKLRYAVMRNSETLPESLGGSDLDLLAYGDSEVSRIEDAVRDVAIRHGGTVTVCYKVEATILCLCGQGPHGGWWGVHIDIFPGLMYFGIPYMRMEPVFSQCFFEKSSFFRCGNLSNVASFIKEILHNGRTKKQYYPMARAAYAESADLIRNAILPCLGEAGWHALRSLLSEDRDTDTIRRVSRKLVRALWWQQLRKHGLSLLKIKVRNVWQRVRRIITTPGYCVVILGTDGSGKSTLIESVAPTIEKMLHSSVHREHLRPNLLPSLASLAGKPRKSGPTTNPHGETQAGWLSSILRFSYYYIDYTLGYWIKIYPIMVKRATMVFFDRYYYEYMIDPKRCAVRLLPSFARFFSWFIPKPDLILCLGGDPNIIYSRKPETSLKEVARQVDELRLFCARNQRAVWIDSTRSIDESRDTALVAIINGMSRRRNSLS